MALRGLAQYESRSAATRRQAEKTSQRSLKLSERLSDDFPDVPLYREALAATAGGYGVLLKRLASAYAEQAMTFLRAAEQKKSKDLSGIHSHLAFEPLRGRADFQKLLAAVPKPAK